MTTDQISFYDGTLRKQIEGSYTSDGKSIHVSSADGVKSVPYNDLGASIDRNAQVRLVEKLLSELARDPGSSKIADVGQQTYDLQRQQQGGGRRKPGQQQRQPIQKPGMVPEGEEEGGGESGGGGAASSV